MIFGFQEQLADGTWAPVPPVARFAALPSVWTPAYHPSRQVRVLLGGVPLSCGQRVELRESRVDQWVPTRFLAPARSKQEPCVLIPEAHRHLFKGCDLLPLRYGDELRLQLQEVG